jgi:hypothetical protein
MSYNFTDEDKQAEERKDYLPFGVNTVEIVGATAGETEAGKDYIEVTVKTGDIEDNARVWFTGGAAKYSFQTIQQIVVHSAKTSADKEKARMEAEKCVNTDDMANLLNSKCVGAECWVTKYYDPTRTYTSQGGETKKSINTNLYGYEPKLKPELMPQEQTKDEIAPVDVDSDVQIPGEWK